MGDMYSLELFEGRSLTLSANEEGTVDSVCSLRGRLTLWNDDYIDLGRLK